MLVVIAADAQDARHGRLVRLLRDFQHRPPRTTVTLDGGQLVDAAQRRLPVGRHEPRADAPRIDLRMLQPERFDRLLVEVVRGGDARLGKAAGIQQVARFAGQVGEVARIEPDTREIVPVGAQPGARFHGVSNAAQRVIGVDEEDRLVRHRLCPGSKRLDLGVE